MADQQQNEGDDDVLERIKPVLTALDTFRTVTAGTGGTHKDWKRSALDNLLRELELFQMNEETKRIAQLEGLLRDLLEHLGNGSDMAEQIREALGLTSVPA